MSATVCLAGASSFPVPDVSQPMSFTTTAAPARARRRACARPSPRPDPVTSATRPARGPDAVTAPRAICSSLISTPDERTQHVLLDLAGGRTREVVDEAQLFRPLLAREPARVEMIAHRVEAKLGHARKETNHRATVLPVASVRRGHDRDLGDAGKALQQLFHLRGTDVLTTADDDVLLAIGDREVPVGIDDADVAGRVPAVGVERVVGESRIGVTDEELRSA